MHHHRDAMERNLTSLNNVVDEVRARLTVSHGSSVEHNYVGFLGVYVGAQGKVSLTGRAEAGDESDRVPAAGLAWY